MPRGMNAFKVELAQRAIRRALEMATTLGGAA
jgi:CO/xanthine dehydrogenase FAD-binding subunit